MSTYSSGAALLRLLDVRPVDPIGDDLDYLVAVLIPKHHMTIAPDAQVREPYAACVTATRVDVIDQRFTNAARMARIDDMSLLSIETQHR